MPLKPKPTPKTPQELEELIELFKEADAARKLCECANCIGKGTKDYMKMTRRLKREHNARIEHHCSLSE